MNMLCLIARASHLIVIAAAVLHMEVHFNNEILKHNSKGQAKIN